MGDPRTAATPLEIFKETIKIFRNFPIYLFFLLSCQQSHIYSFHLSLLFSKLFLSKNQIKKKLAICTLAIL